MSKVLTFSAILGFLFLAACGGTSTGPSQAADFLPLAVNNWWLTDTAGIFIDTKGDTSGTWTGSFDERIISQVEHTGGFSVYKARAYRTITTMMPDTSWTTVDTLYYYFQNTEEELRCYDDTISTQYDILLKYPITLGETWMKTDSSQTELEVTDISATVTVPAGTFNECIVVKETAILGSGTSVTNHYFRRGVGEVQHLFSMEGMSGSIKLNSYNVQ